MSQIPLFPPDLPDELNEARYSWLANDWHYSIIDFIAAITESANPRRYWSDLKRRLESETDVYELFVHIDLPDSLGRMQGTDVANREQLLRIVQSIPSNKVAGDKVERIKRWLAHAGAQVIEDEVNPERAAARYEGKISRKAFMQALQSAIENPTQQVYGIATNKVYVGVLGRDAKQLKELLHAKNPRDKMSVPALRYLDIAEWLCSQRIGEAQELSADQAYALITDIAGAIGVQVTDLERQFGLDIVTGQRLLTGVDAIKGA